MKKRIQAVLSVFKNKIENHAEFCGLKLLSIFRFLNKIQSILRSCCSESQPLSINDETPDYRFRGWKEENNETLNNNLSGWTSLYQGGPNFMTSKDNGRKAGDPELRPLRMTTLCNTKAFTLIELLVVVLIIGMLAAIAVPQYQKAVYKARATEAKVNLTAIANAQQRFYMANGEFTTDLTKLDVQVANSSSVVYACNLDTDRGLADCWANMSFLRYNFSVHPIKINRFCLAKKSTIGEEICKVGGTYKFDTTDHKSSYYQF